MAKQFVVQLKNQPGALAVLAEELATRGVDLRAIGGGSIGDSGHVIMTTADDDTTKGGPRRGRLHLRRGRGDPVRGRRSAGRDGRGGPRAGRCRVNIQGHLFLGRWGDRAMFTFVVDKPDVARPILERKP